MLGKNYSTVATVIPIYTFSCVWSIAKHFWVKVKILWQKRRPQSFQVKLHCIKVCSSFIVSQLQIKSFVSFFFIIQRIYWSKTWYWHGRLILWECYGGKRVHMASRNIDCCRVIWNDWLVYFWWVVLKKSYSGDPHALCKLPWSSSESHLIGFLLMMFYINQNIIPKTYIKVSLTYYANTKLQESW